MYFCSGIPGPPGARGPFGDPGIAGEKGGLGKLACSSVADVLNKYV